MKFSEYVEKVAENQAAAGYTFVSRADAERKVKAVFEVLAESMKSGETVMVPGFGTFRTKEAVARIGRDIRTGKTIEISAKVVPKITFSPKFKSAVAGKK